MGDKHVMNAKSNEPTWSENFVYTDSYNYWGGSHLAGSLVGSGGFYVLIF